MILSLREGVSIPLFGFFRCCGNGASSQQSGADLNSQLSTMNHQLSAGRKLGIDATKKLPGEGFKRPWPPIIRMDAAVKAKVETFFNP